MIESDRLAGHTACRVDDCERRVRIRGLCFAHSRGGEAAAVAPRSAILARDSQGRKRCSACEEWLPTPAFTRDRRSKDGMRSVCLSCHSLRRRMSKFNVSPEWFDTTLADQGMCCAICRSPEPRGRGWSIDHDHRCCPTRAASCGSCIRGILCSPCNLALGLFGDSPAILTAAADYLAERMSIVRGV